MTAINSVKDRLTVNEADDLVALLESRGGGKQLYWKTRTKAK